MKHLAKPATLVALVVVALLASSRCAHAEAATTHALDVDAVPDAPMPLHASSPSRTSPTSRTSTFAAMAGQANPSGVLVGAGILHRRALSAPSTPSGEASRGDLGPYVQAGAGVAASPAYVAPSAHLEVSPAPVLVLRAEYELFGFLGTTRGMVSLASTDASFASDALDRLGARPGIGHKLQLSSTLRARVGPVVAQSRLDAAYYRYTGAGPIFYEIQHDTLVARGDVVIDWRTDVSAPLWRSADGTSVFAGPAYGLTRAVRTEVQRQRVSGALVVASSGTWGRVRRPMVIVDVGVNVEDRHRAGQAFFALGVRGEFD